MRFRTRLELLAAAARVFARRGYGAASIDEIAEEAGFSKGAVYSNFESKENLFITLMSRFMEEHLAATKEAFNRGSTTLEKLQSGSGYLSSVAESEHDWCLLIVEFWSYAVRVPELKAAFADDYDAWRKAVAEMVESHSADLGVELNGTAEDVASGIIALFEGFILQKTIQPDRFPSGFFGDLLITYLAGVASIEGVDLNQLLGAAPARD